MRAHLPPGRGFPYDLHILSCQIDKQTDLRWTIAGRLAIPFRSADCQRRLRSSQHAETGLVNRGGPFSLLRTCDALERVTGPVMVVVRGADLGIRNSDVNSDGTRYSDSHILNL